MISDVGWKRVESGDVKFRASHNDLDWWKKQTEMRSQVGFMHEMLSKCLDQSKGETFVFANNLAMQVNEQSSN